jgi:hypothetical protein
MSVNHGHSLSVMVDPARGHRATTTQLIDRRLAAAESRTGFESQSTIYRCSISLGR